MTFLATALLTVLAANPVHVKADGWHPGNAMGSHLPEVYAETNDPGLKVRVNAHLVDISGTARIFENQSFPGIKQFVTSVWLSVLKHPGEPVKATGTFPETTKSVRIDVFHGDTGEQVMERAVAAGFGTRVEGPEGSLIDARGSGTIVPTPSIPWRR